MKLFHIIRKHDESGVSGTGNVLQGVVFDEGTTVVQWLVEPYGLGFYDSFEDFKKVHIDSHPSNETEIVWEKPL